MKAGGDWMGLAEMAGMSACGGLAVAGQIGQLRKRFDYHLNGGSNTYFYVVILNSSAARANRRIPVEVAEDDTTAQAAQLSGLAKVA